jgi:hypothetical protein
MSSHQASASMLGYLFQLHCGLFLLLSDDNERVSVCLEKYDDVAILDEKGSQKLYQLKLHTKQTGDLTNSSTDLWRTLKVWIDWYNSNPKLLADTKFTAITNATAPQASAAYKLRLGNHDRDITAAYSILKNIAETSENKAHKPYYDAFLSLAHEDAEQLLHNVFIIDKSGDIQSADELIKRNLKYAIEEKYISNLFERLIGWWLKKTEDALISDIPVFISQREVRSKILQIASEYRDDNLPIEEFDEASVPEIGEHNEKVFQAQLRLLKINTNRLRLATKNYYRAFTQRTIWVNDELAYISELDNYDSRLVAEWEHCFFQMEDELNRIDAVTEDRKQSMGIGLLAKVEDQDIRIREKVTDPFVMRGSYHILADDLRVGWHIDYKTLLDYSVPVREA